MDQEAKRKMIQARSNLILSEPFFGSLALRLELVEDSSTPTEWTNGKRLGYNPAFIKSIPLKQVEAEICHEVSHVAYGHPWRLGSRDRKKANNAMDYAINPILKNAGFQLGDDWLLDPQFEGMAWEKIYSLMPDKTPNNGKCGMQGQEQGQGQGDSKQDEPKRSEVRPCTDPDSDTQEAEMQVVVLQAAMAAKAQGKLPAGMEKLIDEIRKTPVDWRSALRKFVQQTAKQDYSWCLPNKRYMASGLYLPALRSENLPPIVVAVDSSGSCWSDLPTFATELTAIMAEAKPEKVYVVCCATRVNNVQEFEVGEKIKLEVKETGGTSFRPVFDWIEKESIDPACLIYLTDLYGDFPSQEPSYPVLWAATTDVKPPFGEVVRLPDE